MSVDDIYTKIIWPLSDKFNSGYNGFTLSLSQFLKSSIHFSHPEILADLEIDESIRTQLLDLIKTRMAPQPKKVRADIEVTCFSIHGVDGIRDAMVGNNDSM